MSIHLPLCVSPDQINQLDRLGYLTRVGLKVSRFFLRIEYAACGLFALNNATTAYLLWYNFCFPQLIDHYISNVRECNYFELRERHFVYNTKIN